MCKAIRSSLTRTQVAAWNWPIPKLVVSWRILNWDSQWTAHLSGGKFQVEGFRGKVLSRKFEPENPFCQLILRKFLIFLSLISSLYNCSKVIACKAVWIARCESAADEQSRFVETLFGRSKLEFAGSEWNTRVLPVRVSSASVWQKLLHWRWNILGESLPSWSPIEILTISHRAAWNCL